MHDIICFCASWIRDPAAGDAPASRAARDLAESEGAKSTFSASMAELASSCTRARRRARAMARFPRETAAGGAGKRGIGKRSLRRSTLTVLPAGGFRLGPLGSDGYAAGHPGHQRSGPSPTAANGAPRASPLSTLAPAEAAPPRTARSAPNEPEPHRTNSPGHTRRQR